MIRRLVIAIGMIAAPCLVPASSAADSRVVQIERWKVDCFPATDEFSVRCEALAEKSGVSVRLDTGDSQLFATVNVKGCPEINYANWWRDEIAGMKNRDGVIAKTLSALVAEAGVTCPAARDLSLAFKRIPDITNVGDPPPKWVTMHGKPN